MPESRFEKMYRLPRKVRRMLGLARGMVRGRTDNNEQILNEQRARSRRRRASQKERLRERRAELERVNEEIRGKETVAERKRSKKILIEGRQEEFELQDELRASRSLAKGGGDRAPLPAGGQRRTGPLPDFVIIGAQKCGTSTLYDSLTLHRHIEPAALKELHFFDNHFEEGIEWYRRCFPTPRWRGVHRTITGEATPAYIFRLHVPARMAEYLPDTKLIVLLRDPVDRAYSHYHHQVRLNAEDLEFKAALHREIEIREGVAGTESEADFYKGTRRRKEFSYVSRGVYADQLLRWLEYFDREKILILKSEDFFEDASRTLEVATRFLGLPDFKFPDRKLRNRGQYTTMEPATRRWLTDYFEPHNQRLYKLLGKNFDW